MHKRLLRVIFISGLLLFLIGMNASCGIMKKGSSGEAKVRFRESFDYDNVLAESEHRQLPVLIYFTAEWCGPCKFMDKYVFSNEKLAERLENEFISLKLDVDNPAFKDLVYIYHASLLPTMVIVNSKGRELTRREGSQSISAMHRFLDEYYKL